MSYIVFKRFLSYFFSLWQTCLFHILMIRFLWNINLKAVQKSTEFKTLYVCSTSFSQSSTPQIVHIFSIRLRMPMILFLISSFFCWLSLTLLHCYSQSHFSVSRNTFLMQSPPPVRSRSSPAWPAAAPQPSR